MKAVVRTEYGSPDVVRIEEVSKPVPSDNEVLIWVVDTIAHRSVSAYARALRPNGTYFIVGGSVPVLLGALVLGPLTRLVTGKSVQVLAVPQDQSLLLAITELCAERQIMPAIDRCYPLRDTREAIRYVSEGHQRGKVVITV